MRVKKISSLLVFSMLLISNFAMSQQKVIQKAIENNQRFGYCPGYYFTKVKKIKTLTRDKLRKISDKYKIRNIKEERFVVGGFSQRVVTYFEFKPRNDPNHPCSNPNLIFTENFTDNRNRWGIGNGAIENNNLILNSNSTASKDQAIGTYRIEGRGLNNPMSKAYIIKSKIKIKEKGLNIISLRDHKGNRGKITVHQFGFQNGKPVILSENAIEYTKGFENTSFFKFGEFNNFEIVKSGCQIKFYLNKNLIGSVFSNLPEIENVDFISVNSKMIVSNIEISTNVIALEYVGIKIENTKKNGTIGVNENGSINISLRNKGMTETGNFKFILEPKNPDNGIKLINNKATFYSVAPNEVKNLKFEFSSGLDIPKDNVSFNIKLVKEFTLYCFRGKTWSKDFTLATDWFLDSQKLQLVQNNKNAKARQNALDYYYGKPKIDDNLCKSILEEQIRKGDNWAINWKGLFIYTGKAKYIQNNEKGLILLSQNIDDIKKEASKGNMEAAYLLVNYYSYSPRTTESERKFGIELVNQLIKDNYVPALLDYANTLIFKKNIILKKDFDFLKKLYEMECSRAASLIGKMYLTGGGVNKDYNEAIKWYNIALEKGDIDATAMLAKIYTEGKGGIKQDKTKAVELLQKAIANNSTLAMMKLANFYFEGKQGVDKNNEKGIIFLQKAAELGHRNAMYGLGLCHLKKEVVGDINKETAFQWINKAANAGHIEAMIRLADIYTNNDFVPPSLVLERYWRNKSGQGNNNLTSIKPLIFDILIEGISTTPRQEVEYIYSDGSRKFVDESPYLSNILRTAFEKIEQAKAEKQIAINNIELVQKVGNKKIYAAIVSQELKNCLYLKSKDKIIITVEGEVIYKKNGGVWMNDVAESSPEGNTYWGFDYRLKQYSEFNHGQLLYKVGNNNKAQGLNRGVIIESVEQEGNLTIILNNSTPEMAKGYFDITIEVIE